MSWIRKFCCCCSCCCQSSKQKSSVDETTFNPNESVNPLQLDELINNPLSIDNDLDQKIAEWQDAINDYYLYEKQCLEDSENGADLELIQKIRIKPNDYVGLNTPLYLRNLAEKKVLINKLESRLGISNVRETRKQNSKDELEPDFQSGGDKDAVTTNSMNAKKISELLSSTWANRLNEINPTQGALKIEYMNSNSTENKRSSNIKIKPRWPDFLIDSKFDVIKINKFGHRMRRTLKLTQHHVISIRNGSEITKFYSLHEIRRVWLEQGNIIKVVQKNDKTNIYASSLAPHILQQIITRIQVRKSLDSTEFSNAFKSLGFSSQMTATIIQQISEGNTIETEAVMMSFANNLKTRTIKILTAIKDDDDFASNQWLKPSSTSTKSFHSSTEVDESNDLVPESNLNTTTPPTIALETIVEEDEERLTGGNADELDTAVPDSSDPMDPNESSSVNGHDLAHHKIDEGTYHEFIETKEEETASYSPEIHSESIMQASSSLSLLTSSSSSSGRQSNPSSSPTTPKLFALSEGTPEFAVQKTVQSIIFDTNHPEGNTRKVFIDEFNPIEPISIRSSHSGSRQSSSNKSPLSVKTLTDIRHFIDGMHEYILTQHGVELAKLYETESEKHRSNSLQKQSRRMNGSIERHESSSPIRQSTDFTDSSKQAIGKSEVQSDENAASTTSPGEEKPSESPIHTNGPTNEVPSPMHDHVLSEKVVDKVVDFNENTTYPLQNSLKTTSEMSLSSRLSGSAKRKSIQVLIENKELMNVEESLLIFLSYIIFIVVEEAMFLPLKSRILNLIQNGENNEAAERSIRDKMKFFSARSQLDWGIPNELNSPLDWQSAIFELSGLEHNLTPSAQLLVLTRTVKAIYNEFKLVVLPKLHAIGKFEVYISADDLVPIFMYVFCHCQLRHPLRNRDLMWALCHPDQLQGEAGYYLTVYESAIEFIDNEPIGSKRFKVDSSLARRESMSPSMRASMRLSTMMDTSTRVSVFALDDDDDTLSAGHRSIKSLITDTIGSHSSTPSIVSMQHSDLRPSSDSEATDVPIQETHQNEQRFIFFRWFFGRDSHHGDETMRESF